MATYPNAIVTSTVFTTKVDGQSVIVAADPNNIQNEVTAIETTLGTNPQYATNVYTSTGYTSATTSSFSTLAARLTNLEIGVTGDVHTQYLKTAGNSVISISTGTYKGLVIQAASGQSANLQEWQNNSGTPVAYITPSGALVDSTVSPAVNNFFVTNYIFG